MTDVQHTPAPWFSDEAGICAEDWGLVAVLSVPDEYYGLETEELPPEIQDVLFGNAALIAAAPELLATLKTVLSVVANEHSGSSFITESLERAARAAIAKAEGRSND